MPATGQRCPIKRVNEAAPRPAPVVPNLPAREPCTVHRDRLAVIRAPRTANRRPNLVGSGRAIVTGWP